MSTKSIGEEIMVKVRQANGSRVRPHVLFRELSNALDVPKSAIKRALAMQIEQGKMAYSYRDPCSFVELIGDVES